MVGKCKKKCLYEQNHYTGVLVVTVWLKLCTSYSSSRHHSPPSSSLAPIRSRTETFWYKLNQGPPENGERERERDTHETFPIAAAFPSPCIHNTVTAVHP